MTAVTEDDRLVGIITDGDLRRRMADTATILELRALDLMTRDPVTIARDVLAVEALNVMERRKITSIIVAGPGGTVDGVVHLHDLWQTELF